MVISWKTSKLEGFTFTDVLHRRALDSSSCPCNCNGALRWSLLSSLHVVIFVCVSEPTVDLLYFRPLLFSLPFLFGLNKVSVTSRSLGTARHLASLWDRVDHPLVRSTSSPASSNPLAQMPSQIHSHNANLDCVWSCVNKNICILVSFHINDSTFFFSNV
jgi:hypothetical protein